MRKRVFAFVHDHLGEVQTTRNPRSGTWLWRVPGNGFWQCFWNKNCWGLWKKLFLVDFIYPWPSGPRPAPQTPWVRTLTKDCHRDRLFCSVIETKVLRADEYSSVSRSPVPHSQATSGNRHHRPFGIVGSQNWHVDYLLPTGRVGLVKNHQKNSIRLCISYMVRYIIWGRPAKKSTHLSQNRPSATTFQFIYCKSVLWD